MTPFFWYVLVVALSILYGVRIRRAVGFVPVLVQWYTAPMLSGGLILGTILFSRLDVTMGRDAMIAVNAVALFSAIVLGLRFWFRNRVWGVAVWFIATSVVGLYSAHRELGNAVLVLVALGISVGGWHVTKRWLQVFFVVMAVFDGYAVWFSDIMSSLYGHPGGLFPAQFVGTVFSFVEIGGLDVIMTAFGIAGIQKHRGLRRAMWYGGACIGAIVAATMMRTPVPFLVVLAPLTVLFLHRPVKAG